MGTLLLVASYILKSLGLYGMAKKCHLALPWLAWLPCVDSWVVGSIVDHANRENRGKKTAFRWILLLAQLVQTLIVAVAVLLLIVLAAIYLFSFLLPDMLDIDPDIYEFIWIAVPIAGVAVLLLMVVAVICWSPVLVVLEVWMLHGIFGLFDPKNQTKLFWLNAGLEAVTFLILPALSSITSLVHAICLFLCGRKEPEYI